MAASLTMATLWASSRLEHISPFAIDRFSLRYFLLRLHGEAQIFSLTTFKHCPTSSLIGVYMEISNIKFGFLISYLNFTNFCGEEFFVASDGSPKAGKHVGRGDAGNLGKLFRSQLPGQLCLEGIG